MYTYMCFSITQEVFLDYLLLARHRPCLKNNMYLGMADPRACMKLAGTGLLKALDALLRFRPHLRDG